MGHPDLVTSSILTGPPRLVVHRTPFTPTSEQCGALCSGLLWGYWGLCRKGDTPTKTPVVRESMAKVREGLERRRREREAQQGWFESWFQSSPWLTTLLSSLMGSLIILLLLLTFGPCILNKLLAFIKQRLDTVQLMMM